MKEYFINFMFFMCGTFSYWLYLWVEKKTFYQLTKEITSLKSQLTKLKNKNKESEVGKGLKKSYDYGIKND